MKVLWIVLDSVGIGHAPDALAYGDAGADTLGHLMEREKLELPHLASLGLYEMMRQKSTGVPSPVRIRDRAWATRLTELSQGKDTTTGHWELAGAVIEQPFLTVEAFSDDFLAELSRRTGVQFLGNRAASGTEILAQLGDEHLKTGRAIVYTSADSVMQMAAHEDPEIFGLARLWRLCEEARALLDERGMRVGRVIARPFCGRGPYQRTANRRDYSMMPPPTVLDRLQQQGVRVVGIGKITDIFAGRGIDESHATKSNDEGMRVIERCWSESRSEPVLYFANLVDFDMLYGHRRDPRGYARALREFDCWLGSFLPKVAEGDRFLITADHGNDPYYVGTDHTREQVPLLTLHVPERAIADATFGLVAEILAETFGLGG